MKFVRPNSRLLSVLSGQTRYAHISALSQGHLDAQMLEMRAIPSEDSIRAALSKLVRAVQIPEESRSSSSLWLDACFEQLSGNVLDVPWVLDVDVTVKPEWH